MKSIIILASTLFLIGCGSSDSASQVAPLGTTNSDAVASSPTETTKSNEVEMAYETTYSLKKGDKIVKTTDDAVVKITRKTQSDSSDVVLLQGSAKIISAL